MYKPGDIVTVYNQTESGRVITEGLATIIKPLDQPDYYTVRFEGDTGYVNRFVY